MNRVEWTLFVIAVMQTFVVWHQKRRIDSLERALETTLEVVEKIVKS